RRQIDQPLDIDRIIEDAQPGPSALCHASLARIDLAAQRTHGLELRRRHLDPVLCDVDEQQREIVDLPRLALTVALPEEGEGLLRRGDVDEVGKRADRMRVPAGTDESSGKLRQLQSPIADGALAG